MPRIVIVTIGLFSLVFAMTTPSLAHADDGGVSVAHPTSTASSASPSSAPASSVTPSAASTGQAIENEIYRVYNPRSGQRVYTGSTRERDGLVEAGWYDEGVAWTSLSSSQTPIYRLYSPHTGQHHYTINNAERTGLLQQNWKDEGIAGYSDENGSVAVYRLYNSSDSSTAYVLTTSEEEKATLIASGFRDEGIVFRVTAPGKLKAWPTGAPSRITNVPIYRLYNFANGEHLYTHDSREVSTLTRGNWYDEGIAWVAPSWSQIPVYRLYNRFSGEHHYTTNEQEVQLLASRYNWKKEGVAWYSSPAKEITVYRQYNPRLRIGQHHYTTSTQEYSTNNSRNGWKGEGEAWYAIQGGTPKANPAANVQATMVGINDPAAQDMTRLAQNYSSSTQWLILINSSTARVGVFQREHGRWWLRHYWAAGPGADRSPTVKGQFTVGNRGYSFGEAKGYSCYYWVQFYGDYLFHSILYYPGTRTVQDATLGRRVSHGCVRLAIENAKWIYDNIPRGTKVVSY